MIIKNFSENITCILLSTSTPTPAARTVRFMMEDGENS